MEDWLKARARSSPTATALMILDDEWTFTDLDVLVDRWCGRLTTIGVEQGQMVGVLLPNNPDHICLIFALIRIQAVLVPLNIRLTASELEWQLNHTDCGYLIYDNETEIQAKGINSENCKAFSAESIQKMDVIHSSLNTEIDLTALQSIIFTSGTTGHPKGVMLSLNNHFASATASAFRLGVLPSDGWLCCLPLYHVGGLNIILRCCLYGIPVILQQGFDLDAIQTALKCKQVSLISLVPTMLHRLLQADDTPLEKLRLILLGGAAASPELVITCQQKNIPIATTYGLSEACSQVATLLPPTTYEKAGSVGKPLLFSSIRIIDNDAETLPNGAIGEIAVRGATVMSGYFKNPEATVKTLKDSELLTGDMGYLDDDGDLWIVQRRSDLIVSGGENIYPSEIERVLAKHPAIAQVCVVGIPHKEWGQQVAAAIVLHHNETLEVNDLQEYCRQQLAGYKIPRKFHIFDELPMTASGKIQRRAVLEMIEQRLP